MHSYILRAPPSPLCVVRHACVLRKHIRVERDGAWEEEGSAASEALATGYTLGRLLGRGAFGSVYHATAPDGTAVAIKKVSMVGVSSAAGVC